MSSNLFTNFAHSAADFDRLEPGQTLLVGMPGTVLADHVYLYTDIVHQTGHVTLRNLSHITADRFSHMVRQFLNKELTRPQDERFIIKAGPVDEHSGYIMTFMDWGERYQPYEYGYYNMFDTLQALDIIAEGFGPDNFLVLRGSMEISVEEIRNLLDHNIIMAIDATPDIVFSRKVYETALETATYISLNHSLAGLSWPAPDR